ncbi:MAG: UDP-glucose 4-epimerase GalE [Candidatus Jacksonbacteria bacterium]|nr:UDP-glucose 4-epimerase GalE [Candidatus Jacksonbacteria bacterium]
MKILITGGTGYIGTHTCVELINQGHQVVVIDNLSNSTAETLTKVTEITQTEKIPFYQGDIRDRELLQKIFNIHKIDAVIHFAGLKAVGESIQKPLQYYNNNVTGTITLLEEMQKAAVKTIIFSSSATVYGNPKTLPIRETHPTGGTTNPYGQSKLIIEEILKDLHKSDPSWKIALLRYFNPVGAHPSGKIGENPNGTPNNLMPYISQVAAGKLKKLKIYGNDYPTPDGTGIRDYIHVVDLAKGHTAALNALNIQKLPEGEFSSNKRDFPDILTINLGTGTGYSVLEMVKAFEQASGKKIPYEIAPRREGDIAECWASTEQAEQLLKWKAKYNLQQMCNDTWKYQK